MGHRRSRQAPSDGVELIDRGADLRERDDPLLCLWSIGVEFGYRPVAATLDLGIDESSQVGGDRDPLPKSGAPEGQPRLRRNGDAS